MYNSSMLYKTTNYKNKDFFQTGMQASRALYTVMFMDEKFTHL